MSARIIVGGGIGAGKSTVLEQLSEAGFFVIEADKIGHDVLVLDSDVGRSVAERWPSVVSEGQLSRPEIARIVFSDDAELAFLESVTHPAIRQAIEALVADLGDTPVAVELPVMGLLGEGWTRVAVVAPNDVRLARAVGRGADPDDVRARMAAQPSDDEWIEWADHVVDNAGDPTETARAVTDLAKGASA